MKSKLFKLFSLIVLIFLGVSLGFAQNVSSQAGKVQKFTSRTAATDSAFQVYTNVSGVENGYDTTTYTGILTSPWKVRGVAWGNNTYRNTLNRVPGAALQSWTKPSAPVQLFPWNNGPSSGSNRYIRIAQGDFSPKFKFFNGDTLFLTFSSGNSGDRARFQFDSSKSMKIYTAGAGNLAYTNYLPVLHLIRFKPQQPAADWTPQILVAGTDYPATSTAAAPATAIRPWSTDGYNRASSGGIRNAFDMNNFGRSYSNYGGGTDNNTVTVRGFNPDTVMIVFDSVINTTATEFPNIYISDLYVQAIDSLLQGRSSGVADTIIAAVGRGAWAYNPGGGLDQRWGRASGMIQQGAADFRLYQPTCYDVGANLGWELANNIDGAGTWYGGTPVIKIVLLPGDAKFVRWNVGIDPEFGWNPTPSTVPFYSVRLFNGIVLPTLRRDHKRVRLITPTDDSRDVDAYKAGDTATIVCNGLTATTVAPRRLRDTLYIFDRDSNITLDTVGSAIHNSVLGAAGTVGLLALDSALSNTPIYPNGQLKVWQTVTSPRGRVVIDWANTTINSGGHYDIGYRLTKVRLATNLGTLGIENDTLNGPTPNFWETTPALGSTFGRYAKGGATQKATQAYKDTCVLYRANIPSKLDVYYRRDSLVNSGTGWTLWTGDITMTRSDVQSSQVNPYAFKAIVKDTFGNIVDDAIVGFQSTTNNLVWDTVWKNGNSKSNAALAAPGTFGTTVNRYGFGARIWNLDAAKLIATEQPKINVPGNTIYTVLVRNDDDQVLSAARAGFDDIGTAGVMVKFYDLCMQSTSFNFHLYGLVPDTTATIPSVTNPLWRTYARTASGGALGQVTYMRLTPYSFNDAAVPGSIYRTSNWPNIPDSVTTSTIAVAANLPGLRNIDTLEVTITDECERPVAITDTNLYVPINPTVANGGYIHSSGNSVGNTTIGRRDSLGQFIQRFIPVTGGNKIRFTYMVPNERLDTVKLVVRYLNDASVSDNIVVRTISGPPVTLALVRPIGNQTANRNYPPIYDPAVGVGTFAAAGQSYLASTLKSTADRTAAHYSDSVLVASNYDLYMGVAGSWNEAYDDFPNTYTFVQGQCRDANGDTVTGGVTGRSITWKLLGPSPASMSLANPSTIFGEDGTGKPKFGRPPLTTIAALNPTSPYVRELPVPVAGDGNAYILLVTGKVGGGGREPLNDEGVVTTNPSFNPIAGITAFHVFPGERQSIFPNAFMTETDSVYRFLWTNGTDWKEIKDFVNPTGTPTAKKVYDNGRGFNMLVATLDGTNWTTGTADAVSPLGPLGVAGFRPLVYHVVPDTSHDLRVAWVDMSGDLFDNATGDLNDRPELQGKSTAKVWNRNLSPANELTLRRMVIKGTGNTAVGKTSYTNNQTNGTNYSGNINTLYVREFDRFGNPIVRKDWQRTIEIKTVAHSSYRPPFVTATTLTNNLDNGVTNPYFSYRAAQVGAYDGVKWSRVFDSSGVVIPRFRTGIVGAGDGDETGLNKATGWPINAGARQADFGTAVRDTNKWLVGSGNGSLATDFQTMRTIPFYTSGYNAVLNAQLRGAIGFKYQTMWVDSSAADGAFANVSDTAVFQAISDKSTYPDTAFVVSQNFNDQPVTPQFVDNASYLKIVGIANNIGSLWAKSPDGYYITWFNLTSAGDGSAIPNPKWLASNIFSFGIDIAGISGLKPKLSVKNVAVDVPNTQPKWVENPDPPVYNMPGMDHEARNSFVKAYWNAAGNNLPNNFWPSTNFNNGTANQGLRMPYTSNVAQSTYAGGGYIVGNQVWYKGYRDGLYKLKLTQNATSTITATSYDFLNIYRFYPDGAHFVTMTNPNSNHPELEPTDPRPEYGKLYPVRANYFANGGHYNPEKAYQIPNANYDTIERYNGLYSYLPNLNPPNDIRNYSSLGTSNNIDTIFYNTHYKVSLRVYDRFGNIIKKPRLWLSSAFTWNGAGINLNNIVPNKVGNGTNLNEWPVLVDTNNIKDTLNLCDTLDILFTQDANSPVAAKGTLMLKYSNNIGSQNQSLLAPDVFNLYNGHDAPDAADSRVMASRYIFVRAQSAPGAFSINANPSKLVRIDNGVFTWTPTWGYAASTNLADDGIKYKLIFANPDGSSPMTVVDGLSYPLTQLTGLSTTLDSATLVNTLKLGPKSSDGKQYNRDIKWYVIAYNKWYGPTTPNLATTSTNSDLVTVELNAVPTIAFNSIRAKETDPAFGVVIVNPDSKMTLTMDQTDPNGIKFGTAAPYNVTSYGVTYPNTDAPIDSLYYQVTLTWKSSFPGTTALPTKVDVINTINPWKEYSNAELVGLLGTEDSVTYAVEVKAVDRAVDTIGGFANAKVSVTRDLTITKIDGNYYAVFSQDSLTSVAMYSNSELKLMATDSQTVKVKAFDSNGDLIRGFKNMKNLDGTAGSIKLKINVITPSSIALDAAQVKVISYSDPTTGLYTATTVNGDGSFTLPVSLFDMGIATFKFQDRRAHEKVNISINIADNTAKLRLAGTGKEGKKVEVKLASGDTTLYYTTIPGNMEKVKTTVTPRKNNYVFLLKAMEVIITPTDKYNNEIITLSKNENVILVIDDDVVEHDQVGNRVISGKTWLYLTPMVVKDVPNYNVLKVGAFIPDAVNGLPNPLTGAFVPVLVVNHIPVGPLPATFKIKNEQSALYITDNIIKLQKHSDKYDFSWNQATDDNNKILYKSDPVALANPNDPRYLIDDRCVVKYTFKVAEYMTYPFSTTNSTDTVIVINAGMLKDIYLYLRQSTSTAKSVDVNYFIIFEDDVYKYSMPMYADKLVTLKKKITLQDDGITALRDPNAIPTVFSLDQNYPNPFNPSTTINYALPKESNVKITIYNVLGQPVRTLVNERQAASYQSVVWDGKNDKGMTVSSGTYIYIITAGDFVQTKKMNLLK